MKVIKHLKKQTPEEELRKFFLEMPLLTKVVLAVSITLSFLLLFTSGGDSYGIMSLFRMRVSEMIFFLVVGMSELKRQEQKGSFRFLQTYLLQNILLLTIQWLISIYIEGYPKFNYLSETSLPVQYLIVIMIEDAYENPSGKKYLFFKPFQIKSKFYPIVMCVLLLLASLRVDILFPLILASVFYFSRVNCCFKLVSQKLDALFLNERLEELGFIKTGGHQRVIKPLDQLATNDSIVLQEK